MYSLLTTSALHWIITNTTTTYITWPSYSLLHYLLPFRDPDTIGWSFFKCGQYSLILFIFLIHQLLYILIPWIFNPFLIYCHFTWYTFQTVWPHYILHIFHLLPMFIYMKVRSVQKKLHRKTTATNDEPGVTARSIDPEWYHWPRPSHRTRSRAPEMFPISCSRQHAPTRPQIAVIRRDLQKRSSEDSTWVRKSNATPMTGSLAILWLSFRLWQQVFVSQEKQLRVIMPVHSNHTPPVWITKIKRKEKKKRKLEIILTLLRQIGIPPPTVAPWREALYKDRQSNRRVGVF